MLNLTRDNWTEIRYRDIEKHIAVDGDIIKLPNKNQIFPQVELDETGEQYKIIWVLEEYEGTDDYKCNGSELFSVFDGFNSLEEAIKYGLLLSERTRNKIIAELQSNGKLKEST